MASARWRDQYFQAPVWDADHLNEIGWWEPHDHRRSLFGLGPARGRPRDVLEADIRAAYMRIAEGLAALDPL